jgi:Calcineurin-like phosphoesterase
MTFRAHVTRCCAVAMLPAACMPVRPTPPPATATAEQVALSGASVVVGAGDIASCSSTGDEATALIVDSLLKADSVAHVTDAVFTLGDNAYPSGSARDFARCFTPTWGDSAKRIMKKIHPAPGNHEHETAHAAPYYLYFGARAGDSTKGYYSYDVGTWHVIVLNSSIVVDAGFPQAAVTAQEEWLRKDLTDHRRPCTMAYWHHPRFSSGWHGGENRLMPIWTILYDANVDVVLNGHDHDYERFAPLTPAGVLDTLRGITEFVVGTGGGDLRGFRATPSPLSRVRVEGYFGVLKLTLGAAEYQHAFFDVSGRHWDVGGGTCH